MKKIIAIVLVSILAMSAAAFAETTYIHDDLTFDYDESYFTIDMEDHTDDEDLVVLSDKTGGYIRIHLRDLEDGEKFPTAEEIAADRGVEVETLEVWGNFKNTHCFELADANGAVEYVFIAPIYDDDGEIDDILTVNIGGPAIEDEDAAMESSDKISAVVDTLRVVD